jgi:hypothetical protein
MKIEKAAKTIPKTKKITTVEVNDNLGCHFLVNKHAQIPMSIC